MSESSDSEVEFKSDDEMHGENNSNADETVEIEQNNPNSTGQQGQGDVVAENSRLGPHNQVHDRRPLSGAEHENFERREFCDNDRFRREYENWQDRQRENLPRYSREDSKLPYIATSIRPDVYSGTEDWEEYFSQFEDCAELGRWSVEDRVLTLAASLRGPARTFYMSLPERERRLYRVLVRRLEERFGSARQQNRWLSRFENRKRNTDETVAALGDDLRQMAQKAYSNLDPTAQEILALNQLYKSISMEMKCRCVDRECKSVADAVDVIERYEALLGETVDKKKTGVRVVSNENCTDKKPEITNQTALTTVVQDSDTDKKIQMLLDRIYKLENQSENRDNRRQGNGYFKSNNFQAPN